MKKLKNQGYIITTIRIPTNVYNELQKKNIPIINVFRKGYGMLKEEENNKLEFEKISERIIIMHKKINELEHRLLSLEKK